MNEKKNLGQTERTLSVAAGSFLLFNGLAGEKKSFLKFFTGGFLLYRGTTGFCPVRAAIRNGAGEISGKNIRILTELTVNKPRNEVYAFWRRLENLPRFMEHLESVLPIDEKITRWTVTIPGGLGTVSWKSRLAEEIPNELIRWKSLPGSSVENEGSIHFHEAGQLGTRIELDLTYRAPLGTPGEAVLKLLNPAFEYLVRSDIRNFKRYVESGEVPAM